ncbi:unnamed protein product [Moneuplotes crassus]|uniref:Uncharacterized protein n=1 Tax=Euplotes crassus TaxID=5936 RepID=A0AAD2D3E1_EUPCR|nr:unnamed protein product [Moneuplotes crassus]
MEEEKYSERQKKNANQGKDSSRRHPNSGECKVPPLNMRSKIAREDKMELTNKLRPSEHQLFIECLKTYGKDWQKLERSIPDKTSLQIKNHAKSFFDMIIKQFKASDPVEYFLKNPELKIDLNKLIRPESLEKSQFPTGTTFAKSKEKRRLERVLAPGTKSRKHKIRSQEESHRMKLKRSSNEVSFNPSSEEMVNGRKKYFIDRCGNPHEVSTTAMSTFLDLKKGEFSVKGNDITTMVPCEIETIWERDGTEKVVVNSREPIKVVISQKHVNKPMVYDLHKKMFFPFSEYSQLDLRMYSDYSQSENTLYQQMVDMLEKKYCLRDIRAYCGQSSERRLSSLNSSGRNRNGEGNGSFQSSSSNRVDQDQNGQESRNNSQPIFHNDNNEDWFGAGLKPDTSRQ